MGKTLDKWLGWYLRPPLPLRVLIGFAAGAILGLAVGPSIAVIEPLGTLMLKLLKVLIIPIIFFAIVRGTGGLPISRVGRIAGKILGYYLTTTVFAATAGLTLAHIFKPGRNLASIGATGAQGMSIETPSVGSVILNMIPDNFFWAATNEAYLQVLIFALMFGVAISYLRDSKDETIRKAVETVYSFCYGGSEIIFTLAKAILQYTPIGVFALAATVFAEMGTKVIATAGTIILACYIGYAFQLFGVYGLLASIFKINYLKLLNKIKEASLFAFATRSSSATLPVSLKVARENLGIPESICGFSLPLGAQINLDGEAYYQIISVFAVAYAAGIHLTPIQQLIAVLVVTIGTMGTAGIAGSGPVVLLAVLGMVGLPIEPGTIQAAVFAIILGIDVILDMGRTCVNVSGDLVGTSIVAKTEGVELKL